MAVAIAVELLGQGRAHQAEQLPNSLLEFGGLGYQGTVDFDLHVDAGATRSELTFIALHRSAVACCRIHAHKTAARLLIQLQHHRTGSTHATVPDRAPVRRGFRERPRHTCSRQENPYPFAYPFEADKALIWAVT